MPRTSARFTQAEIQRAVRAMKAEGFVCSVEILTDGSIRIVPVDVSKQPAAANQPKPKIML